MSYFSTTSRLLLGLFDFNNLFLEYSVPAGRRFPTGI